MTREEAITLIKSAQLMLINPTTNEPVSDLYMALDMAIKALSQEPCDDAISREAVLKLKHHKPEYGDMIYAFDVEQLPSVSTTKNIVNHGTMNITL